MKQTHVPAHDWAMGPRAMLRGQPVRWCWSCRRWIPDTPPQYLCSCGTRFALELGRYGCPNCHGEGMTRRLGT